MTGIGIAFIAVALYGLALKLYVSFETEGGTIGMAPILYGAIMTPLAATFGMWFLTRWHGLHLLIFWLLTTLLTGWLLIYVGRLGGKVHQRKESK